MRSMHLLQLWAEQIPVPFVPLQHAGKVTSDDVEIVFEFVSGNHNRPCVVLSKNTCRRTWRCAAV